MNYILKQTESGFLAISMVLVIAAVVLAIAVSVTYSSIGEGQTSLAMTNGEQSLNLVEGCTEDALLKIRSSASYSGGTISRPEGSCIITMGSGTFTVVPVGAKYTRSIQVNYTRNTKVTVTSWKEI